MCDTKFKALNFEEQDVNPEVQLKEAKTRARLFLDQEMTAREKAQTFVAMSGFPMPFLP